MLLLALPDQAMAPVQLEKAGLAEVALGILQWPVAVEALVPLQVALLLTGKGRVKRPRKAFSRG